MKSPLKLELARELAKDQAGELAAAPMDVGLRAGLDPLHPLYRSVVATSFATWNLLDLWDHKDIKAAAVRAIDEYSGCSCAGRYLGGTSQHLATCEARAAQFFSGESALLFATKNQAVLTLITALASGGGVVIGPAMSSLPLADACALVDLEWVECETLQEYRQALELLKLGTRRVLVVAEAVSATTGKRIDISALLATAAQHGAWVVLDESAAVAHSGLRGAGSSEVEPTPLHLVARIIGASVFTGGQLTALVAPQEVRDLLVQRSRYLRAEPPPALVDIVAFNASLDLIEVAISQRERLLARIRLVHSSLRQQGWSVVSDDDAPNVSLWFDTYQRARDLQEALLQRGFVVEALTARSLRRNGAVARILLSTGHTDLEISRLLDSLLEIRKRLTGQQDG